MTTLRDAEEFIEHHGVKGMKWGKRKARVTTVSKAGGAPPGKVKFTKPAANLSDAELKRRINRLEMEKRYTDLNTEKQVAQVSKGKAFTDRLLKTAGDAAFNALGEVLKKQMAAQMEGLLSGKSAKKSAEQAAKDQAISTAKKLVARPVKRRVSGTKTVVWKP